MLKKINKTDGEGFTIIEVMIVLAVAALILLIVLLAVPALQRNSRNTALKNDASTVAGGISTAISDNDGALPTNVSGNGGTVSIADNSDTENVSVQSSTLVKWEGTATSSITGTSGLPSGGALNTVYVYQGLQCNDTNNGATVTTGNTNTMVLFYEEETSGSPLLQCVTVE